MLLRYGVRTRPQRLGVLATRACACLLALGLCTSPAPVQAGPSHWPLWPNELAQATAALREGSDASEASRAAAVRRLSEFPDALVVDLILLGLADESYEVRRESMRACVDRNLRACLPAAYEAWMNTDDTALRVRALDLFAAHPDEGRMKLLVDALLDDDPTMRDNAASALARAQLDEAADARVRTLLQSKLDDVIAATRRRAAVALGLRGPGGGAVALVRRLDDPDPAVREAAAEALGRMGDPNAVAPLIRALHREPDRALATTGIAALGRLPGETVEDALLEFFDRPLHDRRGPVTQAIGLRASPSPRLVDAMIRRLRDTSMHDSALRALRLMGPAAVPAIEASLARGVELSMQGELERLIAPHVQASAAGDGVKAPGQPAAQPAAQPLPELDSSDPAQVRRALRDAKHPAALATRLGAAAPDWLSGAVLAALTKQGGLPSDARNWMWALVAAPQGALAWAERDGVAAVTRLAGWALEREHSAADSCLAAQALGSAAILSDASRRNAARPELLALATGPRSSGRACAANGLARLEAFSALEALLADPEPTVRAAAALALVGPALSRAPKSTRARLALMAGRDPHAGPKSCASLALATPAPVSKVDAKPDSQSRRWRSQDVRSSGLPGASESWRVFEVQGHKVLAPVRGRAVDKWAVVPAAIEASTPIREIRAEQIQVTELQRWGH